MRHVQIDHGGGDLLMAQQLLDRVQMGAGFQQMGRETVTQRMRGGRREIELLASRDQEPLQRGTRHRRSGLAHAFGHDLRIVVPAADIGKDQERMPVEGPVTAQLLVEGSGQREDPIAMAFAVADEELVLGPAMS